MRIFELLQQSPAQQLDPNTPNQEDDESGKFDADKVEKNLQDIGQSVQDQDAQPDLPGGAEQQDPSLDNSNMKPIDSALLSQVKNLPYATKYDYDDKSALSPLAIAGMEIADLSNLRDMVRVKMQMTMMRDQIGADDDTDMQYFNDLRQFINTVMKFKKSSTRAQMAQTSPSPAYQTMRKPANDNQQQPANDNQQQQQRRVS